MTGAAGGDIEFRMPAGTPILLALMFVAARVTLASAVFWKNATGDRIMRGLLGLAASVAFGAFSA